MNFGDGEFEIKILNTDSIVHNMEEFVYIAVEYVQVKTVKGKYRVIVRNNKLNYEFEIRLQVLLQLVIMEFMCVSGRIAGYKIQQ